MADKRREPLRGRVARGTEKTNSSGKKLCRYCMQEILVKGRRTFCSDLCVHEHRLRSNIDYMRQNVYKRDSGVCSECLLDCVQLAKQISTMSLSDATRWLLPLGYPKGRIKQAYEKNFSLWDADHILPVESGGGGCGLNNMRTLCVPCHLKISRTQIFYRNNSISVEQETLWGEKIKLF